MPRVSVQNLNKDFKIYERPQDRLYEIILRKQRHQLYHVLSDISFAVPDGKSLGIIGDNGAGKSTLSYAICGKPGYEITDGSVTFKGKNFLELEASERAGEGVFLGFQYPVEIPGVANTTFLKEALNSIRRYHGEDELDALQFVKMMRKKTEELGISDDMLKRAVNVGFSGGEKKRNEVLQMAVLCPSLAILDETDSGLDIDALKIVAEGVNKLRSPDRSMLIITHYQRLLDYITPDKVHVLAHGKIQRTGGKELALELEEKGYAEFDEAAV